MNCPKHPLLFLAGLILLSGMGRADPVVDESFYPEFEGPIQVTKMVIDESGSVYLAGDFTQADGSCSPGLVRVGPDGEVDVSFAPGNPNGPIECLALTPEGSIYVGGRFSEFGDFAQQGLVRLKVDGGVDHSFLIPHGVSGSVRGLGLQEEKLLIAGSFSRFGGEARTYLVRVGANGVSDSTFAHGLQKSMAIEAGLGCVASQANGAILIGGIFETETGPTQLARLLPDGSLDGTFSGDPGPILYVSKMLVLDDGTILVAGLADALGTGFVRRLLPNGAVDGSFEEPMFSGMVNDICVDEEGRVLVAARSAVEAQYGVFRLKANGEPDLEWEVNTDGPVLALAIAPNQDVLAGGSFSEVNGIPRNGLVRLRQQTRPAFHSAGTGEGMFHARLQGEAGSVYLVEASADLVNWTTFTTNTATNAGLDILDEQAGQQPRRFFRARLLPK